MNFGSGALAGGEENLDHLPLAAAEFLIPGGFDHAGVARSCWKSSIWSNEIVAKLRRKTGASPW
jgi:hypothetical protein